MQTNMVLYEGWRQGKSLGGQTSGVQGAAPPAGVQGQSPLDRPPEAEAFLVLKSW